MRVDTKDDDADEYKRKRNNILRGALIMLFVGTAFHFAGIPALRNLMGFATLLSLINFFVFRPASFGFQNRVLPVLERGYNKFIGGALKIPYGVFAGTFLLMFLAIAALVIKAPKVEFFPASDPLYVNVFLELPIGKDIEATNAIVKDIEDKVTKIIEPNKHIVEALLVQIGENTSDPNSPPEPGVTPHKARITIQFLEYKERGEISTWDIMDDIRAELQDVAGVKIIIDKNADGPPAGKPINIELQGDDMEDLAILSEEVIQYFGS